MSSWLYSWAHCTVIVAVSYASLCSYIVPRVPPGDSGELMAAAMLSYPAHPPGYPLTIHLYHGWTSLATLLLERYDENMEIDPIVAMHHCTALLMSLAITVSLTVLPRTLLPWSAARTLLASHTTTTRRSGSWGLETALTAAVARWFALRPTTRRIGTETEVFALHWWALSMLLWRAAVLLQCTTVKEESSYVSVRSAVIGVGLWFGLAMSNQHMTLFAVAPTLLCLFVVRLLYRPDVIRLVLWGGLIALSIIFVLYASQLQLFQDRFYFGRSRSWLPEEGRLYRWGDDDDGDEGAPSWWWTQLTHRVLRRDYGTWQLHSGRGGAKGPHNDVNDDDTLLYTRITVPKFFDWLLVECGGTSAVALLTFGLAVTWYTGASSVRCMLAGLLLSVVALAFGFNRLVNLDVSDPLHAHVVHRLWGQAMVPVWVVAGCGLRIAMLRFNDISCHLPHRTKKAVMMAVAAIGLLVVVVGWWSGAITLGGIGTPPSSVVAEPFLHTTNYDPSSLNSADDLHRIVPHVTDAYAESALRSLPPHAVLLTVGDIHLTVLRAAQVCRRVRPDVIHLDREVSWYPWFHAEAKRSTALPWSDTMSSLEGGRRRGGFPNAAKLAELLYYGESIGTGVSSQSRHRHRPSRDDVTNRTLFVLENVGSTTETPKVKEVFALRAFGWFYQVRPKTSPHRAPPTTCRVRSTVQQLQRRRNRGHLKGDVRNGEILTSFLHELARRSNTSVAVVTTALHTPRTALRAAYPWEAQLVQLYHISRKNELLQLAVDAQSPPCTESDLFAVLQYVDETLRSTLNDDLFDNGNQREVQTFKLLVRQSLDALSVK